jgi:hypothetical protein
MGLRLLIAYFLSAFSFLSCSVTTHFYSPNRFYNVPATIYLNHGDSVSGKLTLNNEVMLKKIGLQTGNNQKDTSFHLLEISSYKTGNEHYELKHLMNNSVIGKGDYFMKRLTETGSEIHLFEHLEKRTEHRSSRSVVYTPKYYIQFPNEHRNAVWALNSERLVPHFHQKMGAVVGTCSHLKEKINNKGKGYFYKQFNTAEKERAEVVMRIIKEYNNCQKVKVVSFRKDE